MWTKTWHLTAMMLCATLVAAVTGCDSMRTGYADCMREINGGDYSSVDWDGMDVRKPVQRKHPPIRVEQVHAVAGPVADRSGNIYIADDQGRILRYNVEADQLDSYRQAGSPATQLAYHKGLLVADEQGQTLRRLDDAQPQVMLEHLPPVRDIAIDRKGGMYLAVGPDEARGQTSGGVYYVAPNGSPIRIIDLPNPVGVELAPAEARLYVIDEGSDNIFAFTLDEPGHAAGWTRVTDLSGNVANVRDVTTDEDGNLYLATDQGVRIFYPTGRERDQIALPEPATGLAFAGPDSHYLMITTPSSLYRVRLTTEGK